MFVISYTVIFYVRLCVYDMFHILLSCDRLRDLWNVYVYAWKFPPRVYAIYLSIIISATVATCLTLSFLILLIFLLSTITRAGVPWYLPP